MDVSKMRHPAGYGLDDSGYVVSIVRPDTEITSYVNDLEMISISVPGSPCDVLLAFAPAGAEKFVQHLNKQLSELQAKQRKDRR